MNCWRKSLGKEQEEKEKDREPIDTTRTEKICQEVHEPTEGLPKWYEKQDGRQIRQNYGENNSREDFFASAQVKLYNYTIHCAIRTRENKGIQGFYFGF